MIVLRTSVCVLLISPFLAKTFAIDHDADIWLATDDITKNMRELLDNMKKYLEDFALNTEPMPSTEQELEPTPLPPETEHDLSYSTKAEYHGSEPDDDEYTEPYDDATKNTISTQPTPKIPPCPAEKSLHTEDDINKMIEHLINKVPVADLINGSFYALFMSTRNTHAQRIDAFLDWFQTRPEHLKHILHSMEHTRLRLYPFVKKHENSLMKFSELEISYNEKAEQVKKLHDKLQRYKSICELSCEYRNTELLQRQQVLTPDDYYCSSLSDLYNDVNMNINTEIQVAEVEITNLLMKLDSELKHEIDSMINKLKEVALIEFSRTMYDILELQEKYIHFEEFLKIDLDSLILEMEKNIDETASKLKGLERIVEKVKEQCAKCMSMDNMLTLQRLKKSNLDTRQQETKIVVATLVAKNMQSLIKTIKEQYVELFAPLVNTIDENKQSVNMVMDKLETIKYEISSMTEDETGMLEHLKSVVLDSSIANVHDVLVKSQLLLISLTEIEVESENTIDYYKIYND